MSFMPSALESKGLGFSCMGGTGAAHVSTVLQPSSPFNVVLSKHGGVIVARNLYLSAYLFNKQSRAFHLTCLQVHLAPKWYVLTVVTKRCLLVQTLLVFDVQGQTLVNQQYAKKVNLQFYTNTTQVWRQSRNYIHSQEICTSLTCFLSLYLSPFCVSFQYMNGKILKKNFRIVKW